MADIDATYKFNSFEGGFLPNVSLKADYVFYGNFSIGQKSPQASGNDRRTGIENNAVSKLKKSIIRNDIFTNFFSQKIHNYTCLIKF